MRMIHPCRVRCADRKNDMVGGVNGPHSGPYVLCLFAFLMLPTFSGCGSNTAQTDNDKSSWLIVTDALGREVSFDAPPRRVISVAPKNTELIYALGLQDRLIAVTEFCNYPPEAQELETIGGFTSETINLELIVEKEPDLILCADGMHEPLIPKLENLGLKAVVLGAESLEGMYGEIELLGTVLDAREAAEELSASLKARVKRVREGVAGIPETERPAVFYMVWDDPLMGAGPGSFIGEILTIAGGRNILKDVTEPYPYVSHEAVVARNPQFIFAPTTHSQEVDPEKIAEQPGWEGIHASRLNQIYLLDGDQVSRRGPRMVDALETIAARLHPERFKHDLKANDNSAERADK